MLTVRPTSAARQVARRGATLIGLLVTMIIIVILAAIGLTALKGAQGGGGTAVQQNQATTHSDRMNLDSIFKAMFAADMDFGGPLPTPSAVADTGDKSLDTTANLFSLLIAKNLVSPQQLISGNEQSSYVMMDEDYNEAAYSPARGTYWDPNFKADLSQESNVSFAHVPLMGERYRQGWVRGGPSTIPILGNRGPKDGIPSIDSFACASDGSWAGNIVFADGHIDFTQSPTLGNTGYASAAADNLFVLDDDFTGGDSILTFTKSMWDDGFEMQWD